MIDLRTLTARQLSITVLVGMAMAVGMLLASVFMQRQVVRSMVRPIVRHEMLSAGRAREVDSLFAQYAQAHPDDRSARAQAVERHAERLRAERRDSVNGLLIQKAKIDTAFDWRAESERSWTLRLSGMFAARAFKALGLLTLLALLVLTVVWSAPRVKRAPRSSA